jgi:hypothetical protein
MGHVTSVLLRGEGSASNGCQKGQTKPVHVWGKSSAQRGSLRSDGPPSRRAAGRGWGKRGDGGRQEWRRQGGRRMSSPGDQLPWGRRAKRATAGGRVQPVRGGEGGQCFSDGADRTSWYHWLRGRRSGSWREIRRIPELGAKGEEVWVVKGGHTHGGLVQMSLVEVEDGPVTTERPWLVR